MKPVISMEWEVEDAIANISPLGMGGLCCPIVGLSCSVRPPGGGGGVAPPLSCQEILFPYSEPILEA